MRLLKIFTLVSGILALIVGAASAQILFEDDFESGEVDKAKWVGAASWKIVDNTENEPVLGESVLDILGGGEGLGVEDFPENYDYYAHVRSMNGIIGFIFHGQDANNIYMHQISVTGSGWTPNNTRWHRKVAGAAYTVEPEPFQDGVERELQVWYRVRFEVRGFDFKLYMGDVNANPDQLELVGEWTDPQESFTSGKIGFRMSDSYEYAQYDNVLVTMPGYDFTGTIAGGGIISGHVIADTDGEPVADMLVVITHVDNNFWFTAKTDQDGNYQIIDLPSGDYQVQVDTRGLDFISEYFNDTSFSVRAANLGRGRFSHADKPSQYRESSSC